MYHEQTYSQQRISARKRMIAVIICVVAILAAIAYSLWVSALTAEQAETSVRESIVLAAHRCCAMEGTYPSSLSKLEEDYDVNIDHSKYSVTYEWLGDNVEPSVIVRKL